MTLALWHRGPDEDGFFTRPGLAMGMRRLSLVGLSDGQQPLCNEDGNFNVVFNGELFDYVEKKAELEGRGHRFVTHCDTEIIPHLWEENAEDTFLKLRGQFAIALWDERRRQLTLGRDRFGIAPLYWTRQGDWLLFASEIKALLASGMVPARPDLRGIDHVFGFSAMPGPVTCFEGVRMLLPGHFLRVRDGRIEEKAYWRMDFPDAGQENPGHDTKKLVDQFESILLGAVERRLRADVPVGAYLSGGVDSSMIVALASKLRGGKLATYTVSVDAPDLNELSAAQQIAKFLGLEPPIVQQFKAEDALNTYPELIKAAECPVIDTSCAALLQLARKVHDSRMKAVLTGEGSDEWLVGYPWYKAAKILNSLDVIPGLKLSEKARRFFLRKNKVPQFPPEWRRGIEESIGGPNAWIDSYGLLGLSRLRFYAEPMRKVLYGNKPWQELGLDLERAKKWHPLNRGIWVAGRVTLAGHLLQAKGDRVAMNSSVEVRYPFLDEEVFDFLAGIHPDLKLKGLRDKHLLRLLAERWVPDFVYKRGKVIFRAPLDSFHIDPEPAFVGQLLSEDSLKKTGYFDVEAVRHWRKGFRDYKEGGLARLSVEMGLVAVVATQLWHHTYMGGGLADLPTWEPPKLE
jgi:asparagine synthase (glutamine-hydrolysing)